ncbi:MAG: non-ribosomal peptide synthetase [Muribaculaceae bacterium]|nr:non-ribosomal peptide synthetase [Muribaculaceae bacterium]
MEFIAKLSEYACTNGDKIAIVDNDGTRETTYAEVDAMSDDVARKLRAKGVPAGSAVLVNMGRCREFIIAEIGILKANCAFVPVVPEYPQARIDYIMRDCEAVAVIDNADCDVTILRGDKSNIPENTAFIVYTSGSTGKPKGVVYSRKAFDGLGKRTDHLQGLKDIQYALIASFAFVSAIVETAYTLYNCNTLHILSNDTIMNMDLLEDYYAKCEITAGFLLPKMYAQYKNKDTHLKRIILSAEKVSNMYCEEYELFNVYAQSEALPLTVFQIDKPYDSTPIGKPFADCELSLLNEDGNEVPQGAEGEICVIGNYATCYLNLPEETAKTFEKLPDGRIRIHTGDIGKMLPDGNLVYINRKDWMVKINGQRVDMGEVEVAMSKIDGIRAAAVKDFVNSAGQTYLAGYYVADIEPAAYTIETELAKKLPDYMIPRYFVRLDKLPTNMNGKLNKAALKEPDTQDYKQLYVAPSTNEETALCNAFEKVLSCGRVGINDDFFALGGDSILVIHLIGECHIEGLQTRHVFAGKTPKNIARLISEKKGSIKPPMLKQPELKAEYPLSFGQIYLLEEASSYNKTIDYIDLKFFYHLPATIDIPRLDKAIVRLVREHPLYNARVSLAEGKMFVQNTADFKCRHVSIESSKLKAYMDKLSEKVYDLLNEPLLRIVFIHTDANEHYLFLSISHLISDFSSLQIFNRDLACYYDGKEVQQEDINVFDIIAWEQSLPSTPFYQEAVAFYDSCYKELSALPMFTKYDYSTIYESDILQDVPARKLENMARKYGVTIHTIFLAALELSIDRWKGADNFLYGVVHNGRFLPSLDGTHGPLLSFVYMPSSLQQNLTLGEHLTKVANLYQSLTYYDVIDKREIASKCLPLDSGISLNYIDVKSEGLTLNNQPIPSKFIHNSDEVAFPLEIKLFRKDDEFFLELYTTALSETEAKTFAEIYQDEVRRMIRTERQE